MKKYTGQLRRCLLAAVLVAAAGRAVTAQTTVTWTGGAGDGNYSNPLNWNPNVVPVNGGGNTYNVVIPFVSGRSTVFLDAGTPSVVDFQDFSLADGVTFILSPNRQVRVRDDATINGIVDARGVGTIFDSGTAVASTNRMRLRARDNSSVVVRASSHNTGGNNYSDTLFLAENGGRIELDGTTQFIYGAPSGRHTHIARASIGGVLDFGDTRILGISAGEDDIFDFVIDENSSLLLTRLEVIQANGNGNDYVRLSPGRNVAISAPLLANASRLRASGFSQNASFSAPSLTSLTQSQVILSGTQTFTTGALANIDGSVFSVAGGASFGASLTATTYRSDAWYEILWSDATLFAADGSGSLLRLDSLQNVRFGHGNGRRFQYITADNSGTVRFNGLTSITTFDGEDDVLVVRARTGGSILLPSLATINLTGNTNNYVDFQPGAGVTQNLPSLTSASQTYLSPAVGGSVNVPNLSSWIRSGLTLSSSTGTVNVGSNVSQIDDTVLSLSNGATLAGFTDPMVTFQWRAYGYTVYSADGAGSNLDLRGIGGLKFGVGGGRHTHTIAASNGGLINLNGVQSIAIGDAAQDDILALSMSGGGVISLNGLANVTSAGNGNDHLLLSAAANHVFSLPQLSTAVRLRTSLTGVGAGVNAPNLTSLTQSVINLGAGQFFNGGTQIANLDHSTINVTGGAVFSGVTATSYRSDASYLGLWSGATLFGADGAGSAVRLPTIQTFTFGSGNGDNNYYVSVANGGQVDLSGLRTLSIFNGEDDDLYFGVAASGGLIKLDNLRTISLAGNTNERVQFDVGTGQTQNLPQLTSAHRTYINLGAGASLSAPLLTSLTESVVTAAASQNLIFSGFTNADGSIFRATGGSTIAGIADSDYNYFGSAISLRSGATIFSADGAGSTVDASGVVLIRNGSPHGRMVFAVSATNGGSVNLSGLTTITPYDGQDDILNFSVATGGSINLNGLRNVNQLNTGNGNDYVQFSPGENSTINLPSLLNARRTKWSLPAGSVINAPNMLSLTESTLVLDNNETFTHGALAQIDATTISVSNGAVFGNVTDTAYGYYVTLNAVFSGANTTLFGADGVGSRIELPTLATITYGQPRSRDTHTISATNGGVIDLSGLTSVTSFTGEDDALTFAPSTGGSILLTSLANINQTTTGNNYEFVRFAPGVNTAISLPALANARRVRFTSLAGSSFNAPVLANLTESVVTLAGPSTWNAPGITNLDATVIRLSGGATFAAASDLVYSTNAYVEPFFETANISLWTADGAGTTLNLSGVQQFRLGWNWGNHTFRVGASNGGLIDLSGLTRISMDAGQDDDLAFDIGSGGTINLQSLAVIDVANGNGNQSVTFNVGEGQALNLPSLTSFNSTFFNLGNNSVVNASALRSVGFWSLTLAEGREFNTGGLTNINNSQFNVRSGVAWGTSTGDVLATAYSTTGYRYVNFAVFTAANAGSVLDLSSLQSLNFGWDDQDGTAYASTVSATDNGRVDLSSVMRITSPARAEDRLDFVQTTGGLINLGALATIDGGGRTRFFARDGLDYNLPSLTAARGLEFDLGAGSSFTASSLASLTFTTVAITADRVLTFGGLTNIDNSQFLLSGGGAWGGGQILATAYSTTGYRHGNFAYFSASGAGSVLNASTIQSINAGWNDQDGTVYAGNVNASLGGVLNLSGLRSVITPARGEDRFDFSIATGGSILLNSLDTISGGGSVRFAATEGTDFAVPAMLSLNNVRFELSNGSRFTANAMTTLTNARFDLAVGASFDAPVLESFNFSSLSILPGRNYNFAGVGNIDNSDFQNSSGASWGVSSGHVDAVSYSRTGYRYGNGTVFAASGSGSVLDLSSIQTANFGYDDQDGTAYASVISASNSGIVNLSGLQTLTTPARGEDRLDLTIGTGGNINLTSLSNISGGGIVRFTATEGADFNLPALSTLRNAQFVLGPSSDFNAPSLTTMNFGGINLLPTNTVRMRLVNADNSQISNNSGRAWGASTGDFVATTYSTNGYRYGNFTYFYAGGDGSTLDLSTLSIIDASWNDQDGTVYAGAVTATDSGRVNLSRLRTIVAPARGEDRIDFIANQDGEMNFGSIRTISGGGQTRFRVDTGGIMTFTDLYMPASASLSIIDSESTVIINRTLFLQGGGLSIAPNATVEVRKHFYNSGTSEVAVVATTGIIHMDGTGTQFFEVAGLDLGPVSPGNNGNFGLGQLIVGDTNQQIFLQLLDVYDNGNRGQRSNEALYLYGLGGPDGLVIRGGSTVFLDNLNVYARENGRWVHLNSLFGPNDSVIGYSGGFLHLPSPGTLGLLAVGGLFASRRRR